jgi:hypothetical protein
MATEALDRIREENTPDPEYLVRRRFVMQQSGRDYVTYPGLLDLAHRVSEGRFEIATTLVQVPTRDNGMVAIVTAQAILFDNTPEGQELRRTSGIGDASPANVNRLMGAHLIRLAETRAKARALRDLLNVGAAALEELGPPEEETRPAPQRPSWPGRAAPAGQEPPAVQPAEDRILIGGQPYGRAAVWDTYQRRVAQAREAGLTLAPQEAGLTQTHPLPVLVGAAQALKRRLEQPSAGTQPSSGK